MKLHPDSELGAVMCGGLSVTVHDTGRPGDGRAPILLVHGTGGSAELHFRTVYPMLAARHRVIALDLVVEADAELDDLVSQVVAVIEARAPRTPVHLVGYSLGAVVAAAAAGRRPDLVSTLVTLGGWAVTDRQQRLRHSVWRALREESGRPLQEFQTLLAFSPRFLRSRSDRDLEALIASRTWSDSIDAEMRINGTIDISADIAQITAPTLVVGCTDDQMVPIAHSYVLLGGIEDARFAEVESGHSVTVERAAQVFKLIDDFVGEPHAHPAGSTIPHFTV